MELVTRNNKKLVYDRVSDSDVSSTSSSTGGCGRACSLVGCPAFKALLYQRDSDTQCVNNNCTQYNTDTSSYVTPSRAKWCEVDGAVLTLSDKQIIAEDGFWLADTHISAAQRLIKRDFPYISGLLEPFSLVHRHIFAPSEQCVVSGVYLALQIHLVHQGHWVLSAYKDGRVTVYDSLRSTVTRDRDLLEQLKHCYQLTDAEVKNPSRIALVHPQIQNRDTDCGLFAIATATAIAHEDDPTTITFDQSKMRSHLVSCFEQNRIREFPELSNPRRSDAARERSRKRSMSSQQPCVKNCDGDKHHSTSPISSLQEQSEHSARCQNASRCSAVKTLLYHRTAVVVNNSATTTTSLNSGLTIKTLLYRRKADILSANNTDSRATTTQTAEQRLQQQQQQQQQQQRLQQQIRQQQLQQQREQQQQLKLKQQQQQQQQLQRQTQTKKANVAEITGPIRSCLVSHKEKLCRIIDSQFELLNNLVTRKVLSADEATELRNIKPIDKCNEALLELLVTKTEEMCDEFLVSLETSGQKHIVDYIISDGVPTGDVRPLNESELSVIRDNFTFLADTIDTQHGFIKSLFQRNFMTLKQMNYIKDCQPTDRNTELLDMLMRRSYEDLTLFIDCLHDSHQSHIAKVLEQGGVVLAVVIKVESHSTDDVVEQQQQIVRHIRRLLGFTSKNNKCHNIKELCELRQQEIELVDVRRGSVRLYFWCRTQNALQLLKQWLVSGRLQTLVENWFTALLKLPDKLSVKLTKRGKHNADSQVLPAVQRLLEIHRYRLCKFTESKFELLGKLLSLGVLSGPEAAKLRCVGSVYERNEALYELMCTKHEQLCQLFLTALTETGQQHVVNYIVSNGSPIGEVRPLTEDELSKIYRNCSFFEEKLVVDSILVAELQSVSVITKQQMQYINETRLSLSQKVTELIDILTRRSFADLQQFIRCLHETSQPHVAEVLEHGGVVERVDCETEPRHYEVTIVQQIHRMLDFVRTADEVAYIKQLLELKAHEIELIAADTGSIRLYFWCRTETALHVLEQWLSSGRLKTLIEDLFTALLNITQKLTVSLTRKYSQQTAVQCSTVETLGRTQVTPPRQQLSKSLLKSELYNRLNVEPDDTSARSVHHSTAPRQQFVTPIRRTTLQACYTIEQHLEQTVATIGSLPVELHEMLLMRCSCLLAKTLLPTDVRPDVRLFTTLSSVCRHFHAVLTSRRWFKKTLKEHLSVVCRPYRLHPSLLTTFTGDRVVQGLTVLNNKLYVAYAESDRIIVYSTQQPYRQTDSVHINGLKYALSLATCNINNCLYIVDPVSRCVWRLRTDHKVDKWLDVNNVMSLSVTTDGHVVLLIATALPGGRDSRTYRGKLELYNDTGTKLTTVKLPDSIVLPWCAIQTVNSSFIVSHGGSKTQLCRVCEVNSEGNIVTSYGHSPGSGLRQLDTPRDIVLDSDGRLIVADGNNDRVVLLNRQLNTQRRVFLTLSCGNGPVCLHYNRQTGQLVVGLTTGRVEIYQLTD